MHFFLLHWIIFLCFLVAHWVSLKQLLFKFYWSTVDLQCCDSFCWAVVHIHTSILFQILSPHRWSRNIGWSSLCCTAGPCWPIIPYTSVCIRQPPKTAVLNSLFYKYWIFMSYDLTIFGKLLGTFGGVMSPWFFVYLMEFRAHQRALHAFHALWASSVLLSWLAASPGQELPL